MSLIQEALKRQQEDQSPEAQSTNQKQDVSEAQPEATVVTEPPKAPDAQPEETNVPEPPAKPSPLTLTPTANDPEPQEQEPDKQHEEQESANQEPAGRTWLSVATVLLILIGLVTAAAWGVSFAYKEWRKNNEAANIPAEMAETSDESQAIASEKDAQDRDTEPAVVDTAVGETEYSASVAAVEPDSVVEKDTPAVDEAVPSPPAAVEAATPDSAIPEPFELVEDGSSTPTSPESTPKTKQVTPSRPAPANTASSSAPKPPPKPVVATKLPEPVTPKEPWPTIILGGFVGAGRNGTAILNGEFIGVGETISGVKLLSIERKSVKLSYKGQTQILKMGQTTH